MQITVDKKCELEKKRLSGRAWPFLITDAVYLLLVYGWFVRIHPTGLSFEQLAAPESLYPLPRFIFQLMVGVFKNHSEAYVLVNLFLLYGCMVLVLVLTRLLTRGPWWLGSVAAVLFMATPLKTAALFSLGGVGWLGPGFLGLALLVVYALCRSDEKERLSWLPLPFYILVCLAAPSTISLFAVILLMEYSCFSGEQFSKSRQALYITLVGVFLLFVSGQALSPGALSLKNMFGPLLLFLNPIGFLPRSMLFFQSHPFLGYGLAAGVVLFLGLLIRRCDVPAVRFAFLAIFATRLGQGSNPIDLVTLENSALLLIPEALLGIAVAGGFLYLSKLPRWRPSILRFSTMLCCVAMLCQVWVNFQWYRGGQAVSRFMDSAQTLAAEHPGETLALFPDITYVGFVPWYLSKTIQTDTPFGEMVPAVTLFSSASTAPLYLELEHYDSEKACLHISSSEKMEGIAFRPHSRQWWHGRILPAPPLRVEIEAQGRAFPRHRIAFP